VCHNRATSNTQSQKAPLKAQCVLSARATFSSRSAVKSLQTKRSVSAVETKKATFFVSAGEESRPTVSDTKAKFISTYQAPIPAVFNTVVQELLVSQHLSRYNTKYSYNAVMALGFCSVFDQIFAEYKYGNSEDIFRAFIGALEESPDTYRSDCQVLTEAASAASTVEALSELPAVQSVGPFHNKFTAIGLFRILELAGITDPAALEKMVTASGMEMSLVSRDLLTYKGLLSKLDSAKELQKEIMERERKMTAERMAEKEAKAKAETGGEKVESKAEDTATST